MSGEVEASEVSSILVKRRRQGGVFSQEKAKGIRDLAADRLSCRAWTGRRREGGEGW